MTLDTRIYIEGPIDPAEVFAKVLTMIGVSAVTMVEGETLGPVRFISEDEGRIARIKDGPDSVWDGQEKAWADHETHRCMQTVVGQGLDAWVMLHYSTVGAYRTHEEAAVHDEDCNLPGNEDYDQDEPLCEGMEGYAHRPACYIEVSMDTGYSYNEGGLGCADLHARIVADLGRWLESCGVTWKWKNEFTGEIHDGYDKLEELGKGGLEASAWFHNTVLPAIGVELRKSLEPRLSKEDS